MKYRLIEHNSIIVSRYDDTRKHLAIGKIYEVDDIEVHSWHTRLIIEGKKFNSTCFERVQ